jgi:hypothetical protein
MTKTEYLEQICIQMGIDVSVLPDRLVTTYLSAIIEKIGVMKENGTLSEYLGAMKGENEIAYNNGLSRGWQDGKEAGIAEGIEQGRKSQYDEFWDNGISEYGWVYKFSGSMWNDKTFYPNQDIKPTGNAHTLFALCRITDLAGRLKECGVKLDTSGINGTATSLFNWCALIEHIPYLDLSKSPSGLQNTFEECQKLHTIDGIKLKADGWHPISGAFINCVALENLTIDGTIGQNGFNVQWSTKLTHDSLMSIINALKDYSGTDTWMTITLGAENITKLTQDELNIMTNKQWSY